MLEQKVLDAYAEGSTIALIVECFNIPYKQVIQILHNYKEESRYKKSFTDEFKIMIARRDMNGVTRKDIASELKINANTVKKSCEQFGQALKEKATSENAYEYIVGEFDFNKCPTCGSKRVNEVDKNTNYCLDCGNEHLYDGKLGVSRLKWAYLED